ETPPSSLAQNPRPFGAPNPVGMIAKAIPFAHEDREIFPSLDSRAPGHEPVIMRMAGAAEPEVIAGPGEFVAVEHDLVRSALARLATEQLMLATLAEFSETGVRPVRRRHA